MKTRKTAQLLGSLFLFSITLLFPLKLYAQGIVINSETDSVYVFDNFDIIGSPINSFNGNSGMGWNGSWQAPASNGTVSLSESSLYYPSAVDLISTGGHAYSASPYGQGINRYLLNPVSLGDGPTTFYVSFLTQKDATGNYRIDGLSSTGSAAGFALGVTPDGRLKVNAGNTDGWGAVTTQTEAGLIENNVTYFIVARYQYENSQASVKVSAFKEGDNLPLNDDAYEWDYEATGGSLTTSINSFRLAFSKGLGRIDEFRLGSTWASVVNLDISEAEHAVGFYRFPGFDWEDHPEQFADVARPVSYEIQIAGDEQFTSVVDHDTVLLSRYVHNEPFNTGTYFWRTRSITYDGEISEWQDTLSFTIEEPQEIITVPAPSGKEDCTASVHASVAQAAESAAAGNSVRIVFPAGDYYFGESLVGEVISLTGVRNVEVEGQGATFHFSKRNQGLIEARNCENISASGINVTYAKGILRVQGHVVSIDDANARLITVSLEEGSPDFDASSAPDRDIFILLHPTIDGRIKDNASTFYRIAEATKNQDNTWSVTLADGGDFSDWEAGDRFVYHFRSGSKQYVDFGESRNVTAHNLTTDGWGAMGFVSAEGSNFNILNCKTVIQEGKWMMGNADGVHVRGHAVGPWIEGTEIQATGDDGLAFYARPAAMSSVKPNGDAKAVICLSEYFNLETGDEVTFFQPTEGRILQETTVTGVQDLGGTYLVTFADTVPDNIITGGPLVDITQIWNRSKSCGEFMIRNCKFTNNRRFATVFRSKRGVVQNNQYRGASTRAIHFRNGTAWPNGLYASEIIVRNNYLEDCSFDAAGTQAPIAFNFEGRGTSVQSIGPRNILIEGNVIKDCPSPEIQLIGAANVVIRNNIVINSEGEIENARYIESRSGDIAYSTVLHPTADAYVEGGTESGNNYGSQTVLACKEDADEGKIRRSYLRFDLSPLSGLSVDSVVLRLKTASVIEPGDNLTAWFVSDDSWNESLITWDNKPAKGSQLDSKEINTLAGEWIELSLTNQVLNELPGDQKLSLVLMSGTNTLVEFHSRETELENRPQLIVVMAKTAPPQFYTIQASAGANGSISPSGIVTVFRGSNESFTFNANAGHEIDDVIVNGISRGSLGSYTFDNITNDQKIHVSFRKIEGAGILPPEADAYVQGGTYENNNYGPSENLRIKTSDNLTFIRKSFLRFDLSGLENMLTSAKLRLKLASIDGSTTRHDAMFVSDDTWGETTINWLNKPEEGIVLNSQTTPAQNEWIEFDVTDQAEAERTGDGKISLMLVDATDSEVMSTYYSKEAGEESSPHLFIIEGNSSSIVDLLETEMKIFPNPAKNEFYVQFNSLQRIELAFFDLSGKLLISRNEFSNLLVIPVNHLEEGVYILKVWNEEDFFVEKVLVGRD